MGSTARVNALRPLSPPSPETALARASAMNIETLYLLTSSKCVAAIALYEKLGFVHDARIMKKYGARYARCDVAMRYRG